MYSIIKYKLKLSNKIPIVDEKKSSTNYKCQPRLKLIIMYRQTKKREYSS